MFDPTLLGILSQLEDDKIVLPAMQRPFVWEEERIYRLIDSLLRGFPIGAIMLWKTKEIQRYRRFNKDIDVEVPQIFSYETTKDGSDKYLVLDGQQRLKSLFISFYGTYNHKRLFIDVLSGDSSQKDPGDEYYDCRFLMNDEIELLNNSSKNGNKLFVPIRDLIRINPKIAAKIAHKKAIELSLDDEQEEQMTDTYLSCATVLGNNKSLQVILVDEDVEEPTPLEEILEIFVRVNSGGMVLHKSDLLMSLLDLKWNEIQPTLQLLVRDINESKPFNFTRDDVLKSLLLAVGSETRFDKLVSDRNKVEELATKMPDNIEPIKKAWKLLGVILTDNCKIYSERFFKGGHRSLLPFVLYLSNNTTLTNENRRKIIISIYLSVMSGIFAGAEARMGSFSRYIVSNSSDFPLKEMARLINREYGIERLDNILKRHLDLTLNITHGGITLDKNPEDLQRDHIFPRSTLLEEGYQYEKINHYANFHFLRAKDNANKTNKTPSSWFRNPGRDITPYSDKDLEKRLLTWENLQEGNFENMLEERGEKIRKKTLSLFNITEKEFNALFNQD